MKRAEVKELIDFIVISGKELVAKSGNIKDIGIKKQFLTDEDLRIERGIKEIVGRMPGSHEFYSEEENDNFVDSDSVWIADPISGTHLFIQGIPHYAVVVSHLSKGVVDLAIVYDPTVDKLYVADEEGAFVNDIKINSDGSSKNKVIFAPSYAWKDLDQVEAIKNELSGYEIFPSQGSFAINYCLVSEGLFDGVVSLTKDSFPEFAGCFIANEAGAKATNIKGNTDISSDDRVYICGNKNTYEDLFDITRSIIG